MTHMSFSTISLVLRVRVNVLIHTWRYRSTLLGQLGIEHKRKSCKRKNEGKKEGRKGGKERERKKEKRKGERKEERKEEGKREGESHAFYL